MSLRAEESTMFLCENIFIRPVVGWKFSTHRNYCIPDQESLDGLILGDGLSSGGASTNGEKKGNKEVSTTVLYPNF